MAYLTREAFERLVAPRPGPCISIYLPGGELPGDASCAAVLRGAAVSRQVGEGGP